MANSSHPIYLKPYLPPQHQALVDEYMLDFNIERAAAAVRLKPGQAKRLLTKNQRVLEVLHHEQELRRERLRIDGDRIAEELAKIAFANMRDYWPKEGEAVDLAKIDQDRTAAISELTIDEETRFPTKGDPVVIRKTRIKLHGKQQALMLLGQQHGMFQDPRRREGTYEQQVALMSKEERAELMRELLGRGRRLFLPLLVEQPGVAVDLDEQEAASGLGAPITIENDEG